MLPGGLSLSRWGFLLELVVRARDSESPCPVLRTSCSPSQAPSATVCLGTLRDSVVCSARAVPCHGGLWVGSLPVPSLPPRPLPFFHQEPPLGPGLRALLPVAEALERYPGPRAWSAAQTQRWGLCPGHSHGCSLVTGPGRWRAPLQSHGFGKPVSLCSLVSPSLLLPSPAPTVPAVTRACVLNTVVCYLLSSRAAA